MRRPVSVLVVGGLVVAGGLPLSAPRATPAVAQEPVTGGGAFGDPGGFWNILPPGQDGVNNAAEALAAQTGSYTPHVVDQLGRYESIVFADATPGFAADDLATYFKPAGLGVPDGEVVRSYTPEGAEGAVIRRDTFGVPHIVGETRPAAMYANGYAAAEDRLFLMDLLRHVGRARAAAFLGASPGNLALDADQMAAAPYTEEDLVAQAEALRASPDPVVRQVVADGADYVAGVNQYIREALADPSKLPAEYPALQKLPDAFVVEDVIAIASLVGGIFGKGGGREVTNYCGLDALAEELGDPVAARRVFDDLHFANDAEAPVTAPERAFPFPGMRGAADPDAVPALDCGSLSAIEPPPPGPEDAPGAVVELVPTPPLAEPDGRTYRLDAPWGEIPLSLDHAMSNALLVAGDRTDTGAPIAVFGPQTGYFSPQLLSEFDIQAPGISARGVAFAGTDIYVQLGRGRDYAWSATSAGADMVDQFVLRLCEPRGGAATTASMGYAYRGECREIEALKETFLAPPTAAGVPESPEDLVVVKYFERAADYGPLRARGTLADGTPVAIAQARTTYGDELASARGFQQINDPDFMARGVDGFREAMGKGVDYTFNWFYVDDTAIAYQHSCRCPIRAGGVDPYLPTWGDGTRDYRGELRFPQQPFSVDPAQGYLVSWNNKQARGFTANDGQFGYGPIHRSSMLERRLRDELAEGPVDVGEAVDVMALAATTDLRAQELLPLLERVMGEAAPDARLQDVWDRMRDWAADDLGHRRDHDDDGAYEHAVAIAVMDAWWERLFDAMFRARTGDARRTLGVGLHDAPQNHLGSAFQDKVYAHVHKDLRQVLGDRVQDPFSRTYCGGGDLAACRADLWASLADTLPVLEEEFGSADVDAWQRARADDAIVHTPTGVVGVPEIHWQNRPTFQQVVQVPMTPAASAAPSTGGEVQASASLPATGSGGWLVLGALALMGAAAVTRRGRPQIRRR